MAAPMRDDVDWTKARVVGVEPLPAKSMEVDWSKARVVGTEPAPVTKPAVNDVDWSNAKVVGTEPMQASTPTQAIGLSRMQGLQSAAEKYDTAVTAIATRPEAPGNQRAMADMAHPQELPRYNADGSLTPENLKRLPVVNTGDDMKAMRKRIGGKFVVPGGLAGTQVVLMDPSNVAVATLNNQASWNYWDDDLAPGFQPLAYLGQADPVQQQMAQFVDAAAGRKPTGELGRGMREASADLGEQISHEGDRKMAQGWSYPVQAARGAGVAIDATQEGGFSAVDALLNGAEMMNPGATVKAEERGPQWWKDWRKENRKEMSDGWKDVKDIGETRDYISSVKDPEQLREIDKAAGRGIGEEAGEWASLVSPTAVTKGVGWAVKATPSPVKKAIGEHLSAGASEIAHLDSVKRMADFATENLGPIVSRNPALWRVSAEQAEKIDGAGRVYRNTPDVAADTISEHSMKGFNRVLSRHGIKEGSPEAQVMMRDATAAINSGVEGRKNASPFVTQVIDEWQSSQLKPYTEFEGHRAIDRLKGFKSEGDFVDAKRGPPNPFHRMVGQDITKAATIRESDAARHALEAGEEVAPMREMKPEEVSNLAGIRQSERAFITDKQGKITGEQTPGIAPDELSRMRLTDHGPVQDYAQKAYDSAIRNGGSQIDAEVARDRILKMPFPQAIGETYADVAVATGRPVKNAAGELAEYFGEAAKANKTIRHASTIPEFQLPKASRRGTYAQVTQNKAVMNETTEKMLRESDSVILRAGGSGGGKALGKGVEVYLPPGAEALDGWVVPRYVGIGARDSMRNNAETFKWVASQFNRFLGIPQIKRAITGANMGFDPRNINGSLANHILSAGDPLTSRANWNGLDKAGRSKTVQILNAPLTGGGGDVTIGGKTYDAGALHRELRLKASIGRGIGEEAARMAKEGSRAGAIAEHISPMGSKGLSLASDVIAKPGEAYNAAMDRAYREGLFRGIRSNYRADEAIRTWNVITRMENGATLESAARNMNHLFVDYSQRSNLDEVGSVFVPFWKFYANSLQGAVKLAVTNPSAVRRLDNFRRFAEQQDSADKGGMLNPRFKEAADHYSLSPQYENSGRPMVYRQENIVSTPVSIAGAMPEEVSPIGGMEQGLGRFTGEPWNSIYGAATGNSAVTNRSALNLTPQRQAEAKAFSSLPGILGQLWFVYQKHPELLGPHPEAAAVYFLNKYIPGLSGRLTTPQLDTFFRSVLQLGGSEASRAPQNEAAMIERTAMAAGGSRTAVIDPSRNTAKIARQVIEKTPEHEKIIEAKEIKAGKRKIP